MRRTKHPSALPASPFVFWMTASEDLIVGARKTFRDSLPDNHSTRGRSETKGHEDVEYLQVPCPDGKDCLVRLVTGREFLRCYGNSEEEAAKSMPTVCFITFNFLHSNFIRLTKAAMSHPNGGPSAFVADEFHKVKEVSPEMTQAISNVCKVEQKLYKQKLETYDDDRETTTPPSRTESDDEDREETPDNDDRESAVPPLYPQLDQSSMAHYAILEDSTTSIFQYADVGYNSSTLCQYLTAMSG